MNIDPNSKPQPPDEDPWLRHMDRWELRIMKIAVLCGLAIFAFKLLRHELEQSKLEPLPQASAQVPSAP